MIWIVLASVFTLEVQTILMLCGADPDFNEVSCEFRKDIGESQLNDKINIKVDYRENELMDDRSSSISIDSNAELFLENDDDLHVVNYDELVCANLNKIKNRRKKKKHKKLQGGVGRRFDLRLRFKFQVTLNSL